MFPTTKLEIRCFLVEVFGRMLVRVVEEYVLIRYKTTGTQITQYNIAKNKLPTRQDFVTDLETVV
jgi:hypothetical protein